MKWKQAGKTGAHRQLLVPEPGSENQPLCDITKGTHVSPRLVKLMAPPSEDHLFFSLLSTTGRSNEAKSQPFSGQL